MEHAPKRLGANRLTLLGDSVADSGDTAWNDFGPSRGHVARRIRAIRRGVSVLLWTLLCIPVQLILVLLPGRGRLGRAKVAFARAYWSGMCDLIGLKVRLIGQPATRQPAAGRKDATAPRPVVFVSNHSSWLDVLVLGGRLDACFIAKEEVARWPLVSLVAKLGRTVYVRRTRTSTGRERDDMRTRLADGDSLILFPEGTTSDGSRVMPISAPRSWPWPSRPSPPTAGRRCCSRFPWSMTASPDCRPGDRAGRLSPGTATWTSVRISGAWRSIVACAPACCCIRRSTPPISPTARHLAQATWAAVADGASILRQNRPVPAPSPGLGHTGEAAAAFA